MDNVKESINRAQRKLNTSINNEDYISIKIKPENGGCCCFHCWPLTWKEINNRIVQYGYLEDEGDVAIVDVNNKFVLECHESGPEIIVYLPIGISGAILVANIINLIIKNRQQEKNGARFKIIKRVIRKTKKIEENIIEIDFPISEENVTLLNK